jgi:hypothetical protein
MNNSYTYTFCLLLMSCVDRLACVVNECQGHCANEGRELSMPQTGLHLSTSVAITGLRVTLLKCLLFALLIEREIK